MKQARRHDDILAAARALVTDAGYSATTMEAIAARAGVGKPTLYRWWPNRAALVHEALVADLAAAPVTDLRGFVAGVLGFFDRPLVRRAWLGAVAELADDPAALAAAHQAFLRPAARELQAVLAGSAADARLVLDVVIGAGIAGLVVPGARRSRASRIDALTALLTAATDTARP
ncbi:MAG: TetR/AcrR family transcriptional regulator [Acidimicrobiia bacterium]|nr:TetR/AcrR family transcriptional regulator [Acidimicrobiia bacterium]